MKTRSAVLVALSLAVAASCSSKRPLRGELAVPAADAVRIPAELLRVEVDERRSPPRWIDHPREDGERVYGLGVVRARGNRSVDLYRVRKEAERAVAEWLRAAGIRAPAPRGLLPPLELEPRAIEFEKIAYARKTDVWYCLASLDRKAEAEALKRRVSELDRELEAAGELLRGGNPRARVRVAAALKVLFHFDRRAQYGQQLRALSGHELDPAYGDDAALLESLARRELRTHGVRGELDGVAAVPGLREAVRGTLEQVSLLPSFDGAARVDIRLSRRETWVDDRPFFYLEGEMQLQLEGEDGSVRTVPLRAKGSGANLDEARALASRSLNDQVRVALLDTLHQIASR